MEGEWSCYVGSNFERVGGGHVTEMVTLMEVAL